MALTWQNVSPSNPAGILQAGNMAAANIAKGFDVVGSSMQEYAKDTEDAETGKLLLMLDNAKDRNERQGILDNADKSYINQDIIAEDNQRFEIGEERKAEALYSRGMQEEDAARDILGRKTTANYQATSLENQHKKAELEALQHIEATKLKTAVTKRDADYQKDTLAAKLEAEKNRVAENIARSDATKAFRIDQSARATAQEERQKNEAARQKKEHGLRFKKAERIEELATNEINYGNTFDGDFSSAKTSGVQGLIDFKGILNTRLDSGSAVTKNHLIRVNKEIVNHQDINSVLEKGDYAVPTALTGATKSARVIQYDKDVSVLAREFGKVFINKDKNTLEDLAKTKLSSSPKYNATLVSDARTDDEIQTQQIQKYYTVNKKEGESDLEFFRSQLKIAKKDKFTPSKNAAAKQYSAEMQQNITDIFNNTGDTVDGLQLKENSLTLTTGEIPSKVKAQYTQFKTKVEKALIKKYGKNVISPDLLEKRVIKLLNDVEGNVNTLADAKIDHSAENAEILTQARHTLGTKLLNAGGDSGKTLNILNKQFSLVKRDLRLTGLVPDIQFRIDELAFKDENLFSSLSAPQLLNGGRYTPDNDITIRKKITKEIKEKYKNATESIIKGIVDKKMLENTTYSRAKTEYQLVQHTNRQLDEAVAESVVEEGVEATQFETEVNKNPDEAVMGELYKHDAKQPNDNFKLFLKDSPKVKNIIRKVRNNITSISIKDAKDKNVSWTPVQLNRAVATIIINSPLDPDTNWPFGSDVEMDAPGDSSSIDILNTSIENLKGIDLRDVLKTLGVLPKEVVVTPQEEKINNFKKGIGRNR